MWPTEWPAIPRKIADATDDALTAVRGTDSSALSDALDDLAKLPNPQVSGVHAGIVRELLETLHPDGLTSDDVHAVLERTARGAIGWLPHLDVSAVADVLTGALGVSDPDDETPKRARTAYLQAAVLVIADLAATAHIPTTDYIKRAIAEIARAETVEMP
ncbi:hypothetical protein [Antrihabitans cavernicola]|uniref:Uncharacterized protein n=1 Tax=Antrihabitans cavernicola TaxID=2495913 RepID=A0A5A7SA93_9NOCA|nr:hypothetical protein [Spelaeibacter cavernicola]KAA0022404.1 hypothetical protein FOY51_15260 [Spelaeibacter cavernicola]